MREVARRMLEVDLLRPAVAAPLHGNARSADENPKRPRRARSRFDAATAAPRIARHGHGYHRLRAIESGVRLRPCGSLVRRRVVGTGVGASRAAGYAPK